MIGYSRPARSLSYEPTLEVARLARVAPRPTNVAQTGLSLTFIADLTSKHLASFGVLALSEIIARLGLPGPVMEQVLQFMRSETLVEVRSRLGPEGELRYGLTERGRADAYDALMRNGYVGPAPVPLEDYCDIVAHQSIHKRRIERSALLRAFADVVIDVELCDQLGPALNSGRAIFLYGEPGTGKTFLSQKLARVLPDLVLVPFSIAVNETVIEIFDPQLHVEVSLNTPANQFVLAQGWDARYACCERPVVTVAGELTLEMLEVQRDPVARTSTAPLQLKANNGVFLIDDLGRQRSSLRALFDRWIVPLEEQRDYLSASSGQHFAVPFDQVLVFSTNLDPHQIADQAFLRRIGYKIQLKPCKPEQYAEIWRGVCKERGLHFDPGVLSHAIGNLHARHAVPLLPCHPRDLIGMASDYRIYRGDPAGLDEQDIDRAWHNYFLGSGTVAAAHRHAVTRGEEHAEG
ncbi:MAG: AAA family ATPase [Steroidobacteraceae bacterium]